MPVRDWAACMSTEACRTRLEPDTLERQQGYGRQMMEVLERLGRTGEFWRPQD